MTINDVPFVAPPQTGGATPTPAGKSNDQAGSDFFAALVAQIQSSTADGRAAAADAAIDIFGQDAASSDGTNVGDAELSTASVGDAELSTASLPVAQSNVIDLLAWVKENLAKSASSADADAKSLTGKSSTPGRAANDTCDVAPNREKLNIAADNASTPIDPLAVAVPTQAPPVSLPFASAPTLPRAEAATSDTNADESQIDLTPTAAHEDTKQPSASPVPKLTAAPVSTPPRLADQVEPSDGQETALDDLAALPDISNASAEQSNTPKATVIPIAQGKLRDRFFTDGAADRAIDAGKNAAIEARGTDWMPRSSDPGRTARELDYIDARATAMAALRAAASGRASDQTPVAVAKAPVAETTPEDAGTGRDTGDERSGQKDRSFSFASALGGVPTSASSVTPFGDPQSHIARILEAVQPSALEATDRPVSVHSPAGIIPPAVVNGPDSDLARQIVQGVRLQWRDGVGDAKITLQPSYLGEVSVSLRVADGGVTATLHADSAAVRTWIESNESVLRQALADQGLTLHRLTIADEPSTRGYSQDSKNQDPQHQQQPQGRQQRRRQDDGQTFESLM